MHRANKWRVAGQAILIAAILIFLMGARLATLPLRNLAADSYVVRMCYPAGPVSAGGRMDEQRKYAILFAATILAARKVSSHARRASAPSRTPSLTHSKSLRELTSAGLAAIPTIHKSSDVDSLYRTVDFSRLRSGVRWSFRS